MSIRRRRRSRWERRCSESCRTELQDAKGREFEYELFGLGEDKGGKGACIDCTSSITESYSPEPSIASRPLCSSLIPEHEPCSLLIHMHMFLTMEQDPQAQSLLSPYYLLSPDLLRSVEWFICRRLLQTHFLSLVRHDSGSICGWLMNLCPSPTSKHLHLDIGATYRLRRGGDVPRRISSQGSSAGIAARCWGFNPDKMSSTTAVQKARFSSAFSFLMDTFSLHRRGCNASVQLIGWEYSLKSLWNGAGGRVKVLDWLEQQPIIFEIHLCWI